MAEKKMYRNAIRSRQMIRAAFVEMMQEKPFEKITATDIINRSGLNRSTFYAHYPDVKGILDEITGEVLEMFQNILNELDFATFFDDPKLILDKMQGFLIENEELYRWLGKSDLSYVKLEELKQVMIRQALASLMVPANSQGKRRAEIQTWLLIGGVIDLYRQWLAGNLSCTREELSEELVEVMKMWKPMYNMRCPSGAVSNSGKDQRKKTF